MDKDFVLPDRTDKAFLKVLELDHSLVEQLLDSLYAGLDEAQDEFDLVGDKDGEDAIDTAVAGLVSKQLFVSAWCEVTLVAVYHMVERRLKSILPWVKGDELSAAAIGELGFGRLVQNFKHRGVELSALPAHGLVDLLRVLANSWKHGGYTPDDEVFVRLGIPKERTDGKSDAPGILGNDRIRTALRMKLGLEGEDSLCLDIVQSFHETVLGYLQSTVGTIAAQDGFRPLHGRRKAY